MEWREELEEAVDDPIKIESLLVQVVSTKDDYLKAVADLIDVKNDKLAALDKLRATLFMDRFQDEIDDVMSNLL
jgi:molecular chaperone HscB